MTTHPAPADVDAATLTRLVRRRHALRWLARIGLWGLLPWVGLIVLVQAVTASESPLWNLADRVATPGVLVCLGLPVLASALMLAVRVGRGQAGHAARRMVPAWGHCRPLLVGGPERPGAEHQPIVGPLIGVLFGLLILVAAGVGSTESFLQSHGDVGRVVTVGVDAHVASEQAGRGGKTFELSTPEGEVLAEERPRAGDRFDVYGPRAYRLGGHFWLLIAAIALFGLLVTAVFGLGLLDSLRTERHLSRIHGADPSSLRSNGALTVRVGDDAPFRLRTVG